jgi:hypothetical protein
MFWVFVCSRTKSKNRRGVYDLAGTTEMAPLVNKAADERITKREERHIVVCKEGCVLETAVQGVGANDESENHQASCQGQPWECLGVLLPPSFSLSAFCTQSTTAYRPPCASWASLRYQEVISITCFGHARNI